MTDSPEIERNPTKSSNHRGRLRRFVVFCVIFVALVAGFCFVRQRQFDNEIDTLIEKLDKLDPKWRLKDMESQWNNVPKKENNTFIIQSAHKELPEKWSNKLADVHPSWYDIAPPVLLPDTIYEPFRKVLTKRDKALNIAQKLKDFPDGRFPVVLQLNDKYLGVKHQPHLDQISSVRQLLECDVHVAIHEKRINDASDSILAMFHVAKSISNRPTLISQLMWIGNSFYAIQLLERCLAHGQVAPAQLSNFRMLLNKHRNLNSMRNSVHGELATYHEIFVALRSNQIVWNTVEKSMSLRSPSLLERLARPITRGRARANHLAILDTYAKLLAISKHDDAVALFQINRLFEREMVDDEAWKLRDRIEDCVFGGFEKIMTSEKSRYNLFQCAICGLAAEEFRLKNNRWPKDLSELVDANLLKKIPNDLEDGNPLRFRKTKDGLVIYSVGTGKWGYTEGKLPYDGTMFDNTYDPVHYSPRLEFRLWNPDRRRQPAPPPKKDEPGIFDFPPGGFAPGNPAGPVPLHGIIGGKTHPMDRSQAVW